MLIGEAVQLVLQAAVMLDEEIVDRAGNLNTFILEMGKPVSIVDLAQRMIDFYWKDEARSLGVEFSGLRPGEKLDERLTYSFEEAVPTSHPLIKRVWAKEGAGAGFENHDGFQQSLQRLVELAEGHSDRRAIVSALMTCVPDYSPLEELPLEKPATLV
jgi:FlaA1/EpsC-like NDP-sugar epimerase